MGQTQTISLDEAKVCKDCRSIFTGQRCPCGSSNWFNLENLIGHRLGRNGGYETTADVPWGRNRQQEGGPYEAMG